MTTAPGAPRRLHASAAAFDGRGVLILGPSGSGKSGLLLQLLAYGAEPIADDMVMVTVRGETILAEPPPGSAGLVEARGAGLLRLAPGSAARLVLAVDMAREERARLPQLQHFCITDACLPLIAGKNSPNLAAVVMACLRSDRDPPLLDPDSPDSDPDHGRTHR